MEFTSCAPLVRTCTGLGLRLQDRAASEPPANKAATTAITSWTFPRQLKVYPRRKKKEKRRYVKGPPPPVERSWARSPMRTRFVVTNVGAQGVSSRIRLTGVWAGAQVEKPIPLNLAQASPPALRTEDEPEFLRKSEFGVHAMADGP